MPSFSWNHFDQMGNDAPIEILSAQEGIARGGEHLHHAVRHLEDGDIESATSQVVDGDASRRPVGPCRTRERPLWAH